jgi:hypothetical protein
VFSASSITDLKRFDPTNELIAATDQGILVLRSNETRIVLARGTRFSRVVTGGGWIAALDEDGDVQTWKPPLTGDGEKHPSVIKFSDIAGSGEWLAAVAIEHAWVFRNGMGTHYNPLSTARVKRVSVSSQHLLTTEPNLTMSDLETGETLRFRMERAWAERFSPSGNSLVIWSNADGLVLRMDRDVWVRRLCQLAGSSFDGSEQLKYLPGVTIADPCSDAVRR